ncbi:unnamed protein product [Amaranthus hypochondriacus]
MSRIDHGFYNSLWVDKRFNPVVQYLNHSISDHTSLMLHCRAQDSGVHRLFKYFNYLASHPDFMDTVRLAWSLEVTGSPMARLWCKLKQVKLALKSFHRTHFGNIHSHIDHWTKVLDEAQVRLQSDPLNLEVHSVEKEACANLRKWQTFEDSALRQKAKIRWLKDGDSHTHYFHSVVKEHRGHNRIDFLMGHNGEIISDTSAISTTVISFYKALLGSSASSLKGINVPAMRARSQLTRSQVCELLAPITHADIDLAILDIDDGKSPGIDNFNAHFFKQA